MQAELLLFILAASFAAAAVFMHLGNLSQRNMAAAVLEASKRNAGAR